MKLLPLLLLALTACAPSPDGDYHVCQSDRDCLGGRSCEPGPDQFKRCRLPCARLEDCVPGSYCSIDGLCEHTCEVGHERCPDGLQCVERLGVCTDTR